MLHQLLPGPLQQGWGWGWGVLRGLSTPGGIGNAFPERCGGSGSRDGLGSLLFAGLWSYWGHRRLEQGCICIPDESTGALPLLGGRVPWGTRSAPQGSPRERAWSTWISGWKGCETHARAGWGSPEEELSGTTPSAWQGLFEGEVWPCLRGGAFKGPGAQIAPAKAISPHVRPGFPIAHPWNCSWARLRGVLGSSPKRQSRAGKPLLSREF